MRDFLLTLLSAVLAVIGTISVASFGYFNKDRELDLEMVRISLSILGGENKDTSAPARRYALKALEKYSGVEIPEPDFSTWAENGTVPPLPSALLSRYEADQRAKDVIREVFECGSVDLKNCLTRPPAAAGAQ